jgi:hypothetical protein
MAGKSHIKQPCSKPIGRRCRSAFRQPSLNTPEALVLSQDHGGSDEERAALVNAMSGLRVLRVNVASSLERQNLRQPVQNERKRPTAIWRFARQSSTGQTAHLGSSAAFIGNA